MAVRISFSLTDNEARDLEKVIVALDVMIAQNGWPPLTAKDEDVASYVAKWSLLKTVEQIKQNEGMS